MSSAVVIVSGGIDSTVALHLVVKRWRWRALALAFDYGQRHRIELRFAEAQSQKVGTSLTVISLPWLRGLPGSALTDHSVRVPSIVEVLGHPQPVTYVPFRNQLLLTIACQFAEAYGFPHVVYGAQLHDLYGYWDTTNEFVKRFNHLLQLNRLHKIEVLAPLAAYSKGDNIRLGVQLGIDFSLTYSCYHGRETHCGICPTCAERKKGFLDAGVPDPTEYLE